MSQATRSSQQSSINDFNDYDADEEGFRDYLHDLCDELFPFPGYREYQDEIMYEAAEAFFIDGYLNVVIEGPTGIGKSPFNVTMGRVVSVLNRRQQAVYEHFGVAINGLQTGKTFYTTPQKSLRNQLADDEDLQDYLAMLKGRADYTCGETGQNCADCAVRASTDASCMEMDGCTYWSAKGNAMNSDIATVTFAMLIIDGSLPVQTEQGRRLSFDDRDLVIVDEGHNAEGQSASMFAGFTLSPWSLPAEVYGDAGEQANWGYDRFEDVEDIVSEIAVRAEQFVRKWEDNPEKQGQVEKCENTLRKLRYALQSWSDGKDWVVNIDEVATHGRDDETTKKIQVKPVRVNEFLQNNIWNRGTRRLITSATIPFRDNVSKWGERIGLDKGEVKFISKPTPFPEEHRLIHLNTMVGEMSGEDEDRNWSAAMDMVEKIHSHHRGEKGLIHSVSYPRAKEIGESLDNVMVHKEDQDQDAVITKWQNSDKDLLASPTMMQGVDLHGDKCRWQVLLKAPFAYAGDSRVSFLLNEKHEWGWYMEEAGMDMIQAVGRAVRGGEASEAASFYVIDEKWDSVMYRTSPPKYIQDACTDDPPEHWNDPDAAPWR